LRQHLTYANVVSSLCLFILLGGGAFAATRLPKNSVTSTQIKNGAIKGRDIAKGAITAVNVKPGSLLGSDFNPSTLRGLQGATGPQGPAGKNGATSVVIRLAQTTGSNSAAVACAPGEHATGGGGSGSGSTDGLIASFPLTGGGTMAATTSGEIPDGWETISMTTGGTHRAYVICASP
jgi:hypothetical protein